MSGLCKRLDPIVTAWNTRPLQGARYPFRLGDALVLRIREDAPVKSGSGLIATGVNAAGYREIHGLGLGDRESEATWTVFFQGLKDRGLHGVDGVISDDHRGSAGACRLTLPIRVISYVEVNGPVRGLVCHIRMHAVACMDSNIAEKDSAVGVGNAQIFIPSAVRPAKLVDSGAVLNEIP